MVLSNWVDIVLRWPAGYFVAKRSATDVGVTNTTHSTIYCIYSSFVYSRLGLSQSAMNTRGMQWIQYLTHVLRVFRIT